MTARIRAALTGGIAALALLACPPSIAQVERLDSSAGSIAVERLADGLVHPWGMTFLPDGRLLVTERPGRLRILDADRSLSKPLGGVPKVFAEGQGGLLDVALDPEFSENALVYLSFSEPGEGGASTALGRGRLEGNALKGFEVIFRQDPKVSGGNHFGSRIVFSSEKTLFLTLGDRYKFDPAQDFTNHIGTVIRINKDGSVPEDNPFVGHEGAKPEIWSYGHRNVQAAAIDPRTKRLWIVEFGPKGGDELNLIRAGANYGWPLVCWGEHYDGTDIPDPSTRPDLVDAVRHWTPVISPSGMLFYTGSVFPAWHGSALIGGLSSQSVIRLSIEGEKVTGEERLAMKARIRDVEQAPDGSIYLLTDQDDGDILKLAPASR